MTRIRTASLVVIMLAAFVSEAAALSFKDIAGRWCGLSSNYTFARDSLTVTFQDATPARRFKVISYEFLPHTIKMHWLDSKGEKLFTEFSEFAPNGQSMAQQKNDAGPRRPFNRCK